MVYDDGCDAWLTQGLYVRERERESECLCSRMYFLYVQDDPLGDLLIELSNRTQ